MSPSKPTQGYCCNCLHSLGFIKGTVSGCKLKNSRQPFNSVHYINALCTLQYSKILSTTQRLKIINLAKE